MKYMGQCSSADGTRLTVMEGGNPEGRPLVFVHGYSQSSLCWRRPFDSELARQFRLIAYDLRGHGMSDKPGDIGQYAAHETWAEDLAAVLAWTRAERPVMVGWSFGVEVIRDYLHFYGDESLGGLVLVSGRHTPEDVGAGLLDQVPGLCSADPRENVDAALRFIRNCSHQPIGDDDLLDFVAFNSMACLAARIGMRQRAPLDGEELRRVRRPVQVIHGDRDQVILPQAAKKLLDLMPHATLLAYPDCGHLPFIEEAWRFSRDLATFAGKPGEMQSSEPRSRHA